MADYIYTMEIRLTPDQLKGVTLVQDVARAAGMNLYLTGGAIRDIISGFTIRDLDFTVQGNPLKLQKELERAGAQTTAVDEDARTIFLQLPGNARAEISMARTERFEKTGKPPIVTPATIHEDLRRRDFTVNAMALSLNEGSRGLLLDPFNGVADIEAKLIRILHNYSFLEDPSRMIRATRFAARFHWPLEERTQARYDAAKEGKYMDHILRSAIGHEIAALAHEDDPLHVVKMLEKEAATPSRTWQLLSGARPEMILFLAVTARQQAVEQKIKNFLTKWRQIQQKIPLPEMTELLITPQLPEYPKIARDVFMLLLDGKLRSRTETLKFLKPYAPPPPPPPPPPPKRGRAAKAAAAGTANPTVGAAATGGKKKGKSAAPVPPPPAPKAAPKLESAKPGKDRKKLASKANKPKKHTGKANKKKKR